MKTHSKKAVKRYLVGGLTGLGTSLSFMLAHDALTTDEMFLMWEFGIAFTSPALFASVLAISTKTRVVMGLVIAYLTLIIPVLGPALGASGSEPLWHFAALGTVGGLVWSSPFALDHYITGRKQNTRNNVQS